MKKGLNLFVALVLIGTAVLSFHSIKGLAATIPTIEHTYPSSNDQYVPVDTDIKIEFNDKVLRMAAGSITVLEDGQYVPLDIKEYRKSGNSVFVILSKPLDFNKTYTVSLTGNSVTLSNGQYAQNMSFSFRTNYYDFYELMVINEKRLKDMLAAYSPRQIMAVAPKKYINEVTVLHKKQGALQEEQSSTNGITNIDVVTKSEDVSYVHVDIMKGDKVLKNQYASKVTADPNGKTQSKGNTLTFDVGFSKMPDFYDVRIRIFNSANKEIDSKIVKFSAAEKLITEYNEAYKYETDGGVLSFHELLSDEKLFSSLLSEHNIRDLKVQVVDR
ncbi:Ig-like domain-containing protein [Bacillus infantis]|uniref:Ig-like domain-containing protein n=1 Tax=Bacillus infantis TaxID=324767 RepID=UPI0020A0FF58|nr:Ig-like domain-containing protein [Bacillus infantis]MCP1160732.1 Ig-like domain-containing protein [Bacillus infantis]